MEPEVTSSTTPDWPSFDLPTEVTRDEPAATPAATVPATAATPAATPDPAAQPPAQPSTPAGGAPAGTPSADGEFVPKYRLDADREKFEGIVATQAAQIAALTALVERTVGPRAEAPATPEPAQPSAADLEIRERLLAVFPQLALLDKLQPLADRSDDLLGTVGTVQRISKDEQAYFDRYAQRTFDSIFDRIAALTLGEGKTGKDVSDFTKPGVVTTFTRWVTGDPQRAARYDREDPKLVDEFWGLYKAANYDAARRDAAVAQLQRGAPAVPVGGGGAPVAAAPPQPNPSGLDEDAIHNRAWAARDSVGA